MKTDICDPLWMAIMRVADLSRNYAFALGAGEFEKVTMAQQHVLSAVYSNPGPGLMLKDIAMQLNLTPGAVSQTVDSLVRIDAVERVPAEHDRRAVLIRPSPKGMCLRNLLAQRINPVMRDVLSQVSEKESETFLKILQSLVEKMSELNVAEKKTRSVRMSARKHVMEEIR